MILTKKELDTLVQASEMRVYQQIQKALDRERILMRDNDARELILTLGVLKICKGILAVGIQNLADMTSIDTRISKEDFITNMIEETYKYLNQETRGARNDQRNH